MMLRWIRSVLELDRRIRLRNKYLGASVLLLALAVPADAQVRRWVLSPVVGTGVKGDPYRPAAHDLLVAATEYSILGASASAQWVLCRYIAPTAADFVVLDGVQGVFIFDYDDLSSTYASQPGNVRAQIRGEMRDRDMDLAVLDTPGLTLRQLVQAWANELQPTADIADMGEPL